MFIFSVLYPKNLVLLIVFEGTYSTILEHYFYKFPLSHEACHFVKLYFLLRKEKSRVCCSRLLKFFLRQTRAKRTGEAMTKSKFYKTYHLKIAFSVVRFFRTVHFLLFQASSLSRSNIFLVGRFLLKTAITSITEIYHFFCSVS